MMISGKFFKCIFCHVEQNGAKCIKFHYNQKKVDIKKKKKNRCWSMKHDSMRLMRQSKWKASLTCIYFWLLSFYCRWIPSWGLAHNWPLIQSPNSLWRSISQDCLYGKFYYLLDDSCVLLDSRHQIWTPTAHYKTHTHTPFCGGLLAVLHFGGSTSGCRETSGRTLEEKRGRWEWGRRKTTNLSYVWRGGPAANRRLLMRGWD